MITSQIGTAPKHEVGEDVRGLGLITSQIGTAPKQAQGLQVIGTRLITSQIGTAPKLPGLALSTMPV